MSSTTPMIPPTIGPPSLQLHHVDISEFMCMQTYGDGERVRCSTGSPDCVDGTVNGKNKFTYPVGAQLRPCTQEGLTGQTMISIHKAFGGDLIRPFVENKPLYACVRAGNNNSDALILSGLAAFVIDDAVNLPCQENGSVLARINFRN